MGTSEAFGNVAACEPSGPFTGKLPVAVPAKLEGLEPDTSITFACRRRAKRLVMWIPVKNPKIGISRPGPAILASVTDLASTSVTFTGRQPAGWRNERVLPVRQVRREGQRLFRQWL